MNDWLECIKCGKEFDNDDLELNEIYDLFDEIKVECECGAKFRVDVTLKPQFGDIKVSM